MILRIWLTFIILTAAITPTATADQCPSSKCQCIEHEVANRREVRVVCNGRQHRGYVPVFSPYSQTISSLTLDRAEIPYIGNNTFRSLSLVRELYLNDNYLSSVQARAFANIESGLELLDLQHNRISSLRFLTTHDFGRLRELLLRDNRLAAISPDSFAYLPVLENLNLDDNELRGRLGFLQQPSLLALSYLNLDANQLTDIYPEDFRQLRHLKSLLVNRNQLHNLNFLLDPVFKQLHGLSAAGNQISQVSSDLFTNKRLMKWIDLSSNHLVEANFTTSCSLINLEEVYLSHNQLTSLPEMAFQATQSLTIFVVNGNRLSTLPRCSLERFYHRMETFDISDNPLQCDCNLSWLQKPHTITTERQSQCSDVEFTETTDFSIETCKSTPICVKLDECTPVRYTLMYDSVTQKIRSAEISTPTSGSASVTSNRQLLIQLCTLLIYLYYYHPTVR